VRALTPTHATTVHRTTPRAVAALFRRRRSPGGGRRCIREDELRAVGAEQTIKELQARCALTPAHTQTQRKHARTEANVASRVFRVACLRRRTTSWSYSCASTPHSPSMSATDRPASARALPTRLHTHQLGLPLAGQHPRARQSSRGRFSCAFGLGGAAVGRDMLRSAVRPHVARCMLSVACRSGSAARPWRQH
jgi:hypothetical protein